MPHAVVLGGWFHPLTAAVAARIQAFADNHPGRKIAAIVFDGEEALLPAASRAILIAALRSIDAVAVLPAAEWPAFAPDNSHEWHDTPQSPDFIELVLRKSAAIL